MLWEEREQKFFWRGSTTGGGEDLSANNIEQLLRVRLCRCGSRLGPIMDLAITKVVQAYSDDEAARIENRLRQLGVWGDLVHNTSMARYQFLLDIDGNANSWGFLEKLIMGSCVIKVESRNWEQWFYKDLKPWVHYVPVAADLSDLPEQVDWCLNHANACARIAANGQEIVRNMQFDVEMRKMAHALVHGSSQTHDADMENALLSRNSGLEIEPVSLNKTIVIKPRRYAVAALADSSTYGKQMNMFNLSTTGISSLVNEYVDGHRVPIEGHFVDFLGVVYKSEFLSSKFEEKSGTLEPLPDGPDAGLELPQVVGLLHSIERAEESYGMISLGAGFGEWALKARKAWDRAKRSGSFRACCVEADQGHVNMIYDYLKINFASDANIEVRHAAVAAMDGVARFPVLPNPNEDWGASIVSVAESLGGLDSNMEELSPEYFAHRVAAAGGRGVEWTTVPAIKLATLVKEMGTVDYIHSDLQGSEVEVFSSSIDTVTELVRMVSIETHSTEADERLTELFESHGWLSEYNRPWAGPDGTLIWVNQRFAPNVDAASLPSSTDPGSETSSPVGDAQLPIAGGFITTRKLTENPLISALETALQRAMDEDGKLPSEVLAIEGMSGRKYRLFINNLIEAVGNDARYLEVGVWMGSTLCSAIHGNKVRALAIDNWSQFGGPMPQFLSNLSKFKTAEANVSFLESDFRSVNFSSLGKFNVYLFDGPHEMRDQHDGVELALPALDESFVLIVDDWNWAPVREGTIAAISKIGMTIDYMTEIRTTLDDTHPVPSGDWHNGYLLAVLTKNDIMWDARRSAGKCQNFCV